MNRLHTLLAAAVALCGALATPALAAGDVSLASDVKVDRIVVEDGKERHVLAPVAKALPGEMLVFTTRYSNTAAKPVDHFVLTNPIPAAVRLSDDGFGSFDVSVDGGRTYGKLASLTVSDTRGVTRPAQAADVTHLRWVIATIAPGAGGVLEYHGTVR
ncbi:MAG: hypothetical protein KGN34_02120 [Sphingomonadales bacterium]|nr:hypothetical protein [Sphingomonadales bacterium]